MDREFEPVPVRQAGVGGRARLAGVAAVLTILVVVAVAATSPRQITSVAPSASATALAVATPPIASPPASTVIEAKSFAAGLDDYQVLQTSIVMQVH